MADASNDEIERITSRIRQVDLAKALAARGNTREALQLLHKVRDLYDEPAKRQLVDWMIRDLEGKSPAGSAEQPA